MSYKLNAELINTTAIVEEASSQISEVATEAISAVAEPVQIGSTITFGTAGNFESTHKSYLIWDDGVAYQNNGSDNTQIKQNKGFKVKAAANATITITFFTNYGQYFLVDDVRVTSDIYTITVTEDKDIYVTTDREQGAYIVSFYISKANFSINDVLFKNVKKIGGDNGLTIGNLISEDGFKFSSCSSAANVNDVITLQSENTSTKHIWHLHEAEPDNQYAPYLDINVGITKDYRGSWNSPVMEIYADSGDVDYCASRVTINDGGIRLHSNSHDSADDDASLYITSGYAELMGGYGYSDHSESNSSDCKIHVGGSGYIKTTNSASYDDNPEGGHDTENTIGFEANKFAVDIEDVYGYTQSGEDLTRVAKLSIGTQQNYHEFGISLEDMSQSTKFRLRIGNRPEVSFDGGST